MLALLLGVSSLQLSASTEEAVRLRIGALPALWKLQTDVEALQGYLENPAKSFLQIAGPDCACIGKSGKAEGPDCACIGKTESTPTSLVAAKKGPDCACIGKTEGPDCACIGKAESTPTSLVAAKKGPDCACIG